MIANFDFNPDYFCPDCDYCVECFTYSTMTTLYDEISKDHRDVSSCRIEVCTESQYKNVVLPRERWVVKLTFCDAHGSCITVSSAGKYKYGVVVFANSLDQEFSMFMRDSRTAEYKPSSDGVISGSFFKAILKELTKFVGKSIAPNFTSSMVLKYRSIPGSSIVVISASVLKQYVRSDGALELLTYISDDSFLIIEYDKRTDKVIKGDFISPDFKVRTAVNKFNGIVVIEQ